jgi:hypothetical protein
MESTVQAILMSIVSGYNYTAEDIDISVTVLFYVHCRKNGYSYVDEDK